jgi:hypothetical protein
MTPRPETTRGWLGLSDLGGRIILGETEAVGCPKHNDHTEISFPGVSDYPLREANASTLTK